ncbi:MAG: hypothetical protein ACPGSB_03140 [Opitutales bacterium]
MKFCIHLFLLSLLLQCSATAALKIGDNLETTLAALGNPVGTIDMKDKTLLLYPQGKVVLREDAVTEIDLMSELEYQAEQERRKEEREQWVAQQTRLIEARKQEGEAILQDKRLSKDFSILPAKERVNYWRSFQARYPDVDASEELAQALEGYETELAELKSQQRIAELEARVALAEQEAATARLETEKLKKEAERTRESTRYGLRYYHDPVVHTRYNYRPPTVTIYTNDTNETCPQTQNQQQLNNWTFRSHNPNSTAERVARILQYRKK